MAKRVDQLELFPEFAITKTGLIRKLRESERPRVHGWTRAEIRRLMRPLPKITVPGWRVR
jgi:hypothetical protein